MDANDTKPWYLSTGVIGSLATVAIGIAVSLGVLSPEQGEVASASAPELLSGVATTIAGVIALIGRIRATRVIGK